MLRGIEVGDILNTPREAVLIKALQYEEELMHMRTLLQYKGAKLDNSNMEEVNAFNDLLKQYNETRNPSLVGQRNKVVSDNADQLKALRSLDMSKLNVGKSKAFNEVEELVDKKEDGIVKIF